MGRRRDGWKQELYAFVRKAVSEVDLPAWVIRQWRIVRIEDGKLRDRLATSQAQTREVRNRTIRTSERASRADARTYLRDLYTNPDKVMVCQACHCPMPFKLPTGKYYFEAVELFGDLEHEYRENYLALCPVCAAKFRHASEVDPDEFRDALQSAEVLRVEVTLAGDTHQIRFVNDHRTDLLAVAEVNASRADVEVTA